MALAVGEEFQEEAYSVTADEWEVVPGEGCTRTAGGLEAVQEVGRNPCSKHLAA